MVIYRFDGESTVLVHHNFESTAKLIQFLNTLSPKVKFENYF